MASRPTSQTPRTALGMHIAAKLVSCAHTTTHTTPTVLGSPETCMPALPTAPPPAVVAAALARSAPPAIAARHAPAATALPMAPPPAAMIAAHARSAPKGCAGANANAAAAAAASHSRLNSSPRVAMMPSVAQTCPADLRRGGGACLPFGMPMVQQMSPLELAMRTMGSGATGTRQVIPGAWPGAPSPRQTVAPATSNAVASSSVNAGAFSRLTHPSLARTVD